LFFPQRLDYSSTGLLIDRSTHPKIAAIPVLLLLLSIACEIGQPFDSVLHWTLIMSPKAQLWFVYGALDRNQDSFRLLKLFPAEKEAPVHCEIVNARISGTTGTYSALSYAWGEAQEQRFIQLNGKPFAVSPNLLQALEAIRNRDIELLVWVDAVCINQMEVAERNHQVTMMGDIYRNAKSVLAWIGPALAFAHPNLCLPMPS